MRNIGISLIIILLVSLFIGLFTFSSEMENKPEKNYYEQYKADYKIFSPPLPDKIDFAGENTPLDIFYVSEDFEREVLVNTYWHSNTLLLFKRANRWFPVIEPILKANNIPDDFKYLALIESGLTQASSPAGAKGFWQFMKSTATSYGLEVNSEVDERFHVEKSTLAACKYLQESYNRFGRWTLVAASYNMGMGGVNKQLNLQQADSYYDLSLNVETARYVYRILALKTIFEKPSKYGFQLREKDLYPPLKVKITELDSSSVSWAEFAAANNISYQMLKELNPWLLTPSLHNSSRKNYAIKLPQAELLDYSAIKAKMSDKLGVFGEQK
jgi:hypothetical protein